MSSWYTARIWDYLATLLMANMLTNTYTSLTLSLHFLYTSLTGKHLRQLGSVTDEFLVHCQKMGLPCYLTDGYHFSSTSYTLPLQFPYTSLAGKHLRQLGSVTEEFLVHCQKMGLPCYLTDGKHVDSYLHSDFFR